MGSVVGGLYAAGYSPEEIDKLFNDIDWVDLFSDRPSENMLSFRNKKDFQRLAVFELGMKKRYPMMFVVILSLLISVGCFSGQALAQSVTQEEEINTGQDFTKPLTRFDFRHKYQDLPNDKTAHFPTLRVDKPITDYRPPG